MIWQVRFLYKCRSWNTACNYWVIIEIPQGKHTLLQEKCMLYSFSLFSDSNVTSFHSWSFVVCYISIHFVPFCSLAHRSMKISSQILLPGCEYLVLACYRGDSQISKCAVVFTWCSFSALCLLQWLPSGRAQVSMVWPHSGAVTLPSDTHVAISQGNPNTSPWSSFHFINTILVFK